MPLGVSVALGPFVLAVATPPVGSAVLVAALRAEPPVAALVMRCVPVVLAVVLPWARSTCTWFGTCVYECVWLGRAAPVNVGALHEPCGVAVSEPVMLPAAQVGFSSSTPTRQRPAA